MVVAKRVSQELLEVYSSPRIKSTDSLEPKKKIKIKDHVVLCVALILVMVVAVFTVMQYSQMVSSSRRITHVERDLKILIETNNDLQVKVSQLNSLMRIERIAIEELGMQYPEAKQWRMLAARQD